MNVQHEIARSVAYALLAGFWILGGAKFSAVAGQRPLALREPIAAASVNGGAKVLIADRAGGRLSLVDIGQRAVVAERVVGKRLSDVAVTADGSLALATDEASHTLVAVRIAGGRLDVVSQTKVSDYPVGIRLYAGDKRAIVAGMWSRRLDFLAVDRRGEDITLRKVESLALPFAPRRLLVLPDERHAIVSDAFAGQLLVVDLEARKIVRRATLDAHNIYGLAWDAEQDRLLIAHQILNSTLPITFDNVQWGVLMKNVVRVISRAQLFDTHLDLSNATRVISLGQDGQGSADPTAVLPLDDGSFAATIGGVDQLAVVESTGLVVQRIPVGRRPIALLRGRLPHTLLIVNQFSATIDVIEVPHDSPVATISLGALPASLTPAERGKRTFYDGRLSFEGWMSCHSCHTEGHTHGLLADTLGDGDFGAPKRTLTLLGTHDTDPWAWNAQMKELHDQVRKSIETSMHGQASADDVFDLGAYLHSLAPPPPAEPPRNAADQAEIEQGRRVFAAQGCGACHIPSLTFTSSDAYDVGLEDQHGRRLFNPPSLRGVGHGQAFFHDSRAGSLEDVFDLYGHQLREPLTDDEQRSLLRYLRSL
jgi:cytochrome c peroxidase